MSSSNNPNLSDKRTNFLERVEKEAKPEEREASPANAGSNAAKPKGTFLDASCDRSKGTVVRKAPSCGYRGG